VGWHQGKNISSSEGSTNRHPLEHDAADSVNLKGLLKDAAEQISELKTRERELKDQLRAANRGNDSSINVINPQQTMRPYHADVFDTKHTAEFASGMAFVNRDAFASTYDLGVPLDESGKGNDRVLLLYSDLTAFPEFDGKGPLSVEQATSNCHNMHLILTAPRKNQCLAIMGQYESYHVHKYMRISSETGKIDPEAPLTYQSRGKQQNGRTSAKIPTEEATKSHWESLVSYLQSMEKALEDLKPILEKVASHNDNNAVIVMVCNFGQSELLLNFICNARAKGFGDVLKNVFLFATDQVTHDLAQSMGITSVYIESIFGSMPEKAARRYADKTFREMMIAKVYCIQLVCELGFDILFQDVDIVWYKNPLIWFHDTSNPHYGFDMYFQDDGNHALFYAPYSANTGFYYVRNNERTRYFFNSFLMSGDRIISSGSHQIPLIAHLAEQASLNGLRVKTWERNKLEFPGGYNFHKRKNKDFLKELMNGNAKETQIFHMSWTSSKIDKVKFYQQMGEWYLKDACEEKPASEIPKDCCEAEPIVTCHYRDKPSKIPCKDSPPIDNGARSWW